jgi:hypothetical protein
MSSLWAWPIPVPSSPLCARILLFHVPLLLAFDLLTNSSTCCCCSNFEAPILLLLFFNSGRICDMKVTPSCCWIRPFHAPYELELAQSCLESVCVEGLRLFVCVMNSFVRLGVYYEYRVCVLKVDLNNHRRKESRTDVWWVYALSLFTVECYNVDDGRLFFVEMCMKLCCWCWLKDEKWLIIVICVCL